MLHLHSHAHTHSLTHATLHTLTRDAQLYWHNVGTALNISTVILQTRDKPLTCLA